MGWLKRVYLSVAMATSVIQHGYIRIKCIRCEVVARSLLGQLRTLAIGCLSNTYPSRIIYCWLKLFKPETHLSTQFAKATDVILNVE